MNADVLPLSLLERLRKIYPADEYARLLEGLGRDRQTTLRVNTLKSTALQFLEKISGFASVQSVPWNPLAFVLVSPSLREFSESHVYNNGDCYVQSFSSMLPPIILAPDDHDSILDLCAAPGSKTSQMAALMHNTGTILAVDSSHVRIYRLEANLKRLGVTNTRILRSIGQGIWHEYPEYFDKVLVDVPCSMEGRINLQNPKTYEDWSTKKIKELTQVQQFLLRSAVSATKIGGTIVYATCTLSPEENEGVIDWICKKEGNRICVEPIDMPGIPFTLPVLSWNGKSFHPGVAHTRRILPSTLFEGFFIAKIKKLASTVPKLP